MPVLTLTEMIGASPGDVRVWIRRRLGEPQVRVELTDEHLDDAINWGWNRVTQGRAYPLDPHGCFLLKRYALCQAKKDLGHMRNKFSSISTPTAEVTLDGAQLIAEAMEDERRLGQEVEMRKLLNPLTLPSKLLSALARRIGLELWPL
jgi:hypothetical protein